MNPFIIVIPVVVALILILYGILRVFGRIWLEHSMRLALLEKIESKPHLLESYQELLELMAGRPEQSWFLARQDYRVTGVVLGIIGVVSCVAGRTLRCGRVAVGIYVGGFVCIGLAILIAGIGVLIHWLSREEN